MLLLRLAAFAVVALVSLLQIGSWLFRPHARQERGLLLAVLAINNVGICEGKLAAGENPR